MKEVEAAGENIQSVYRLFSTPAVAGGTGQMTSEFDVFARHSFLSFVVRIVPSPDWFLGVDSFNLSEGDHWKESITLELYPYDAGTDSSFTFSSPNFETIPQAKVTEITSSSPSHPANSFYYPRLKNLPPMGKVTLTKIKSNQIFSLTMEPTQFNQTGKFHSSGLRGVCMVTLGPVQRQMRRLRCAQQNALHPPTTS
ncbi:hypothetical protein J4Q44_G00301930 [Coregonus suidteri]|uniref:Spondin domain-containing protein n=1 Tax=Coregonus suidteri TaxID=861788 RepID=A0AAN8QIU0_9TELE